MTLLGHRPRAGVLSPGRSPAPKATGNFPESFDWREKGCVNPVKDQGSCGSCWAFSVIQAQESQWARVHGDLHVLSEQNLVDCVTACNGCNGGDNVDPYEYVINEQDGLWNTEADYPYMAIDQDCKFDKEKGVCPVKSWFRPTTTENEDEFAEGLAASGVVAIAIDASCVSFQLYTGGVYDEPKCGTSRNHAVGAVGYGVDNGVKYWIVRNSWGPGWGEHGYIRMVRGKGSQCSIAGDTIIPQV